jgi:uncharacterized protein (TIGR03435 family)
MHVRPLRDRIIADGTLQVLMQYAFGVQSFQILGGPGWTTTARYEVEAKASAAVPRDQLYAMLQPLLEERFALKTHRETRDLPLFVLTANRGVTSPPAPASGVCADSPADGGREWAGGRMAVPGELPASTPPCGTAVIGLGPRGAHLLGGKIAMPEFTRLLSMLLGRHVVDRTGIAAPFDASLEFVPDDTTPGMPPPPPGSGITGPSMAQALQQRLGLRLEATRGPVDVIIVDQAEPPSAN